MGTLVGTTRWTHFGLIKGGTRAPDSSAQRHTWPAATAKTALTRRSSVRTAQLEFVERLHRCNQPVLETVEGLIKPNGVKTSRGRGNKAVTAAIVTANANGELFAAHAGSPHCQRFVHTATNVHVPDAADVRHLGLHRA